MQAFAAAIDEYVEQLARRHGERLASVYLVGSVAREEAVPGISDVNLLCVYRELPDPDAEDTWHTETTRGIEARHPDLCPHDATRRLLTASRLLLSQICPPEPDASGEATEDVLELHWGGRRLHGEEIRPMMPSCPPPGLPHARAWAERARQVCENVTSSPPHPDHLLIRLAGHSLAGAALSCCLAVLVTEGQGFTLQSSLIAERFGERHPEWADWAREFARSRVDPPTTPEHLAALAEAARLLCDWSTTILHTIGLPHNLRV
jgi:hypothetical protein